MPLDPHLPVVVGVAQLTRKPTSAAEATEPIEMMATVLEAAADDAGPGAGLLGRVQSVRVIETLAWRYPNPGALLGERLGMPVVDSVKVATGGNSPQMALNDSAAAIQRGDVDVVAVVGAEAVYTRLVSRKQEWDLNWAPERMDLPAPRTIGIDRPGTSDAEQARSLVMPTQVYPVFENAVRHAAGRSIADHQVVLSELWASFSAVAAANPYAWSPEQRSAEEIRTVDQGNRMIGFPYPKLMNANIQTDQAAAVIMCSVEAAEAAGVPRDRWVFLHAGADAHDHWFVSERDNLFSSPAIRACGASVYGSAGIGADDLGHVDLYSCFPCAVEVSAGELGLSLDRQLTVTGGLTFAGGPGNNYVTHSVASMVDVLRNDAGSLGLCTANGWYLTKHSAGVYSTEPPSAGAFRHAEVQAVVDATPSRAHVPDHDGAATVESYTVMYDRDNTPATGIVACLTPDGARTWANTTDPDLLTALTTEDLIDSPATLKPGGRIDVS